MRRADTHKPESRVLAKRNDASRRLRTNKQHHAIGPAGAGNRAIEDSLHGIPLDPSVRVDMEQRFGTDFGDVRVHNDTAAHANAAAVDAQAFTVGDQVVFGAERYAPQTHDGKRLLAHELAHVVQQRRGGPQPNAAPDAVHERSAERAADQVAAGAPSVTVQGGTAVGIARAPVPEAKPFDPAEAERQRELQRQAQERERLEMERATLIVSLLALRRRPHRFHKWYAHLAALQPGFVYSATHALLGRFGFGASCKVDYTVDDYLQEFDAAIRIWAAVTKHRFVSRDALNAPIYDPEEIEHHMNQVILQALPDGTGYIGTRRDFKAAEQEQIKQRNLQTMQNIAGGLGGAIGWATGGHEGSDLGATGDAIVTGRTRGGGKTAKPRKPARTGSTARTKSRQTNAMRTKLAAQKPISDSSASSTGTTATVHTEPLVVAKVQGKNKGEYWRDGTPQFSKNAGSTKKDGAPKNPPDRKHVVLPEGQAKDLGFREAGQQRDYKIEPRSIGSRQAESAGAGRRSHQITARTTRKTGRSTGKDLEATKPDKSAQHGFDRTIKADNAQAQGYNALLDRGEYGILRPNNVSTRGVDAITASIDGQGKAKIFLNDFTTPGTGKPSKPSHRQWKAELLEAAKAGRLDFGNTKINEAIRSAIDAGEIYVRKVGVTLPAQATTTENPKAGVLQPTLDLGTPVKLRSR